MRRSLTLVPLSLFLLFLITTRAQADTIVLNSLQQGWYSNNGLSNGVPSTPNNYFVGASGGQVFRNYFVFNLNYVTAITSAQLRIYRPGDSDLDTDPYETYELYAVNTQAELLGTGTGVSIYDDLGSGAIFASLNVATPMFFFDEVMTIDLNADALAAMQGGGLFAVGGALTTLRFPPSPIGHEGLFGASQGRHVQLIVEGQQLPVPEPGTLLLLGSGLVGAVTVFRKRRRAGDSN